MWLSTYLLTIFSLYWTCRGTLLVPNRDCIDILACCLLACLTCAMAEEVKGLSAGRGLHL